MAPDTQLSLRPGAALRGALGGRAATATPRLFRPAARPLAGVPTSVTEVAPGALGAGTAEHGESAVAPVTAKAYWQGLLPALEDELGAELRAFRKAMLAARVSPDYVSDLFPGRRSGAWAIFRDVRTLEGHQAETEVEFSIFVRRAKDQLAVWEGAGRPDSLRANFATAYPGPPVDADAIRTGLAAALGRHGLSARG